MDFFFLDSKIFLSENHFECLLPYLEVFTRTGNKVKEFFSINEKCISSVLNTSMHYILEYPVCPVIVILIVCF